MTIVQKLLACLASLVLPPAGPLLAGRRRMGLALAVLAVLGLVSFFFIAWGPGLLLWGLGIGLGWISVLSAPGSR